MKIQRRISLQPGYLLHRRAYRDASVIAEFLTRDHGRVALVVRGAGKGSRRCLEAFTPLLLSFTTRGELGSLATVEAVGSARSLAHDEVFCAYYANELVLRLTHKGEPLPELFEHYGALLEALAAPAGALRGLRLFEKRLLDQLGYGADLTREWPSGRPLEPARSYRVAPEQGPEPVANAVRDQVGDAFSGASLLSLAHEDLGDSAALRDARRLLRLWLDYYLDGRPLKSRQVMQAMRRSKTTAVAAGVGVAEA